MPLRCVNLDWLEVHCREPQNVPHDWFYFQSCGYRCAVREYGTRVYRQMFTLLDNMDEPLLEIRRDPASQGLQGLHDPNECHIRLCNRTCYFDNAAIFLKNFLDKHGYYDIRISRVDICLDFVRFDDGDNPKDFVRRYFKRKYSKINQGRINAHGSDTWSGQVWNSLSWGSKTSLVTTKMYNKTMELYDAKLDRYKKPYIRQAWLLAGLIDNIQRVTKDGMPVDVWRVEFSLSSGVKNWISLELNGKEGSHYSIPNRLDCYSDRSKILIMFASLAQHYFHFKHFSARENKYRCPDKILFKFAEVESVYKIGRNDTALGSGKTFLAQYNRLIEKLQAYQMTHSEMEIKKACSVLINSITEENLRADLANPWDREELEFLKTLLYVRTSDKTLQYDAAVEAVKKLLKITNKVLPKKAVQ